MSAMVGSATAMPGVRSSSSSTRSGSTASRAACRSSSVRCAETVVQAMTTANITTTMAAVLAAHELRAIVIGRITIDGMDVIDAALRRVLDDQGGPLDPEVRGAAVDRRPAPGEVGLREVCPDLGHP